MPIFRNFFIFGVAASVSEWQLIHSLTLAATTRSSRSSPAAAGQLRGIGPTANERGGKQKSDRVGMTRPLES